MKNIINKYKILFLDIFISGGRDGRLILWDYRMGKSGSMQLTDYEINEMKSIFKKLKTKIKISIR